MIFKIHLNDRTAIVIETEIRAPEKGIRNSILRDQIIDYVSPFNRFFDVGAELNMKIKSNNFRIYCLDAKSAINYVIV